MDRKPDDEKPEKPKKPKSKKESDQEKRDLDLQEIINKIANMTFNTGYTRPNSWNSIVKSELVKDLETKNEIFMKRDKEWEEYCDRLEKDFKELLEFISNILTQSCKVLGKFKKEDKDDKDKNEEKKIQISEINKKI